MKPFKYICRMGYIANCPTCDGTYPSGLKFFKSIKEMLTYALDNLGEYEIEEIYSYKRGVSLTDYHKESLSISYRNSYHNAHGIDFRVKKLNLHTIDNGHGKRIWARK